MPKAVSIDPKDAYVPKLGFQEGWGEIVSAKSAVVQFNANKTTGSQLPRLLALVLEIQRQDEKGASIEEETQQKELVIEWGNEENGELRPLRLQPGTTDGAASGYDAEGLGEELGTEGNCIFSEDGLSPRADNPFMVFIASLAAQGFKPAVLGTGYFPDLVGTRGHFVTRPGKQNRDKSKTYDDFVMDKITRYPYEKQSAKANVANTAKSQVGAAPKGGKTGAGTTAAATETKSATNGDGDPSELALRVLRGVAGEMSGQTITRQKLTTSAFMWLLKKSGIDKGAGGATHRAIQDTIKNDEWLQAHAEDAGMIVDEGNITIT